MQPRSMLFHPARTLAALTASAALAAACSTISGLDDFTLSDGATSSGDTARGGGGGVGGEAAGGGGAGGVGGASGVGGAGGMGGGGGCGPVEIPGNAIDDDCDGTALVGGESAVVRYFINEDPAQNPVQIQDAVQPPLPLTIINPPSPALLVAEDAQGHRGLRWTMIGTSARASAEIAGTKVATNLDQKQVATIEVVADLNTVVNGTRFIFIGHDDGSAPIDDLSLRFVFDTLRLFVHDMAVGNWDINSTLAERVVLHIVLDTTEMVAEDRRKLYINGYLLPSESNALAPAQGLTIDTSESTHLSLGNSTLGSSSPEGMVHYAAVYAAVLSEAELQSNAALLLLDDDAP